MELAVCILFMYHVCESIVGFFFFKFLTREIRDSDVTSFILELRRYYYPWE